MGMPPPPPRFDGTVSTANHGGAARAMPPPPPLFSSSSPSSGAEIAPPLAPAPEPCATPTPSPAPPPARAPPSGYTVPDWGGPSSADFSLEVLKDGAIVDVVDCGGRNFVTLGRTPDNDVVLEHPSSSRVHAVMQFSFQSEEMFVFDTGSTHGTFVNKRRLKPNVHAPVFVGDQVRFGQSSRVFVVSGAVELMPEEGLSLEERRKLKALERMSQKDIAAEQLAKKERQANTENASGSGGDGVWGTRDGADDEQREADLKLARLDWREHDGGFSDKQSNQRDKIKKKEDKVTAFRLENERIRAKETSANPLTLGQQTTLVRNAQIVEKLESEIDDADETLNESIRASISGRKSTERKQKKQKKNTGGDSDESYGSDSDDAFYDRTRSAVDRRRKKVGGKAVTAAPTPATVETAATLWEKREVATAAMEALLLEQKRAQERAAATKARTETVTKSAGTPTDPNANAADDLDLFMDSVASTRDAEDVTRVAGQIAAKQAELARLARLLVLADPHGTFAPGSQMQKDLEKVAEAEKNEVARSAAAQRRRAELKAKAEAEKFAAAAEKKRLKDWEGRGELVAKKTFAGGPTGDGGGVAAATASAPSSVDQASSAANAKLPVGMSTAADRRQMSSAPVTVTVTAQAELPPAPSTATAAAKDFSAKAPPAADDDGFLAPSQLREAHKRGASVLEIRNPKRQKEIAGDGDAPVLAVSAAEARVAEDVARLLGGRSFETTNTEDDFGDLPETGTDFVAPSGQSGDGRTSLNDKLGY